MASDLILEHDKKQSISDEMVAHFAKGVQWNPMTGTEGREPIIMKAGVKCGNDSDHGRLTVHGSGGYLLCTKCGFMASLQNEAVELKQAS